MSNSTKEALYERLKAMEQPELVQYGRAAKTTNTVLNFLGVALMFGLLVFDFGFAAMLALSAIIYVLANLSAGVGNTLVVIKSLIEDEDD